MFFRVVVGDILEKGRERRLFSFMWSPKACENSVSGYVFISTKNFALLELVNWTQLKSHFVQYLSRVHGNLRCVCVTANALESLECTKYILLVFRKSWIPLRKSWSSNIYVLSYTSLSSCHMKCKYYNEWCCFSVYSEFNKAPFVCEGFLLLKIFAKS